MIQLDLPRTPADVAPEDFDHWMQVYNAIWLLAGSTGSDSTLEAGDGISINGGKISATGINKLQVVGAGASPIFSLFGSTATLKSITGSGGISITDKPSGELDISFGGSLYLSQLADVSDTPAVVNQVLVYENKIWTPRTLQISHIPSLQATLDAKQPFDADLAAIAALSGTPGNLRTDGAGVWTVDSTAYQPLDGDLTAIAALAGATGLARKTAANTWTLDTNTYLTGNQTITLSGGATGSGTTSIPVTLSNAAVINQPLTGYVSGPNSAVAATDSILGAFGKLQAQVNAVSGGAGSYLKTDGTNAMSATLPINIGSTWSGPSGLVGVTAVNSAGVGFYGQTTTGPVQLIGYRSGGTPAAKTATQTTVGLLDLYGAGYDGTNWKYAANISILTSENWSSTANGTYIGFNATPRDSATSKNVLNIYGEGIIDIPQAGSRIRADFSNSTLANRAFFQDITPTNAGTTVGVLPPATSGIAAALQCFGLPDPANSPFCYIQSHSGTGINYLVSGATGTGTQYPLAISVNGAERARFDLNGNFLLGRTTSSGSKLDIICPTNQGIAITDGTISGVLTPSGLGGLALFGLTNHPLIFGSNNTQRLALQPSGTIQQNCVSLATTAGATFDHYQWISADSGNTVQLKLLSYRPTAGSGHTTHSLRIQRQVDSTQQGFIEFTSTSTNIGSPAGGNAILIDYSYVITAAAGMLINPSNTTIGAGGVAGTALVLRNNGISNYGRTLVLESAAGNSTTAVDGPFVVMARYGTAPAYWQYGISHTPDSTDFYIGTVDNAFGGRQFRFKGNGDFVAAGNIYASTQAQVGIGQNAEVRYVLNNSNTSGYFYLATSGDVGFYDGTRVKVRFTSTAVGDLNVAGYAIGAALYVRDNLGGYYNVFFGSRRTIRKSASTLDLEMVNEADTAIVHSFGNDGKFVSAGPQLAASSTSASGYTTGAGGSVTQGTNKTDAVTINKPTGKIITSSQSLAAGSTVIFQVNNSVLTAEDVVVLNQVGGNATYYRIEPIVFSAGVFFVRITNLTGAAATDAISINFVIIKGSAS